MSEHFLESHERDVTRLHVEALANALNDCCEELDQLGAAYSALRKKHEPPYVAYIPWSRPEVVRILQALRLEKVWDGEKYVLRLRDVSFQDTKGDR